MSDPPILTNLPLEQQAIRAKCFHPTGTFVEFEKDEIEQSIPERFEKLVRIYSERVAIETKELELTYEELNRTANRLAHAILALRGTEQEPIALLLDHDAMTLAAIFAVLKAGKFYVPLNPSYPRTRTAYMLEDSQATLLVTNNNNLSLARELGHDALKLINVDALDSALPSENLGLSLLPDTLACILYTSGSTGYPKGVFQSHRNLLHKIMAYTNDLKICPDDRLSLLYSYSFAASLRHIFGATLNGAGVFLFDLNTEDLTNLAPWLINKNITICHLSASLFRGFTSELRGTPQFSALRVLYVANESVVKRDVELYKAHFSPACIFVNALVATESLTIRQFFADKTTAISVTIVPVGYAVRDEEVLLLDEQGGEVTVNEIGEIAVKSRYLALGYWRKPELTRAAFVLDPKEGNKLIYRTGDLGRMLPDGCLLHLGRKDFQIKIRGHRIETAEIETALLELDVVKEAMVTAQPRSGEMRLVAYWVPKKDLVATVSELRGFLQEKLPNYMIPSTFMRLLGLPRTPTGKVDRLELPDPGESRPDLDTPFVAPKTPVEEALAKIWAEVLSLDQVGIHDNFFDLGGDSLSASRVVSKVIQSFQLELPLKTLFDSPTVAEMAAVIIQNQANQATDQDLERLLSEVEAMPEAEAGRKLASTRASRENPDAER
jgi:amino acid adenylation domain-containing protein